MNAETQAQLQQALHELEEAKQRASVLQTERDALAATVANQGSHIDVSRETVRALQSVLVSSTQNSQAQMRQLQVRANTNFFASVTSM